MAVVKGIITLDDCAGLEVKTGPLEGGVGKITGKSLARKLLINMLLPEVGVLCHVLLSGLRHGSHHVP